MLIDYEWTELMKARMGRDMLLRNGFDANLSENERNGITVFHRLQVPDEQADEATALLRQYLFAPE
jgi:hypothetical protein